MQLNLEISGSATWSLAGPRGPPLPLAILFPPTKDNEKTKFKGTKVFERKLTDISSTRFEIIIHFFPLIIIFKGEDGKDVRKPVMRVDAKRMSERVRGEGRKKS